MTTRWSLVMQAGEQGSPVASAALEELCRSYWKPLYVFARRQGLTPADAEDATQGFFERLLAREDVAHASPDRGRFRTFLLTSYKHYLINLWRDARRVKRGGGQVIFSMDGAEVEPVIRGALDQGVSPDLMFDRQWAENLLEIAVGRLRAQYASQGKVELLNRLVPHLWASQPGEDCEELARVLGMSGGAARVALHRARTRLRECIRAEIASTVETSEQVELELRTLISVLRGG